MMFVFDTNILSAMMTPQPVPQVRAWMGGQNKDLFFTTSISQAEILSGLAVMADGRRRRDLQSLVTAIFAEDFEGRVLSFDATAAAAYAELFSTRKRAGRPAATMDLMIASVARSHGASVVTRDTGGFEGCGLTVIDPCIVSLSYRTASAPRRRLPNGCKRFGPAPSGFTGNLRHSVKGIRLLQLLRQNQPGDRWPN